MKTVELSLIAVATVLVFSCSRSITIDLNIKNRNERISSYLEQLHQERYYPGLQYVVFDKSGLLDAYSFGFADVKNKRPMDAQTKMNVFSTTKVITAICILQLQEQGRLSLDDEVKWYLDYIPYEGITIRQLLSHSSGLPDPILGNFFIHWQDEHTSYDRDAFIRDIVAKNSNLKYEPGSKAKYSNLGYALLGQIIEQTSGLSYEEYVQSNVFAVFGLNQWDIHFNAQDYSSDAKPYYRKWSLLSNLMAKLMLKGSVIETEGEWKSLAKSFYFNFPAHGGIITHAIAYSNIFRDLLKENSRLLGEKSKKLLFTEQIRYKRHAFALSWSIGELDNLQYFYHQGGGIGYVAEVRLYPGKELGSILLMNLTSHAKLALQDTLDCEYLK